MQTPTRLLLIAIFVSSLTCSISAHAAGNPNIIVIYTDDQGFGDASCLNPKSKFQTPNIDRLAKEGINFTDAHCSDTVCTPSRYGLLTGRYSWRTTLKRGVFGAEAKCLIDDGRETLATMLKTRGYHTAMVGKWHLGMDFPGEFGKRDWTQPVQDMPLDKGFDYYYGIPASMNYGVLAWFEGRHAKVPPTLFAAKKPNQIALADYRVRPPYEMNLNDVKAARRNKPIEVAPDFVDAECLTRFTDKAIAWMQSHVDGAKKDQPFFLYLPYTSPHKPVIPLPKFRGQGAAGAYGEFMIETDDHIGRILKFLDDAELAANTLIVFSSDNGPETTWKQRTEKYQHHSNGIYRDGKRAIYEGGHRVPFIIRWPNGVKRPGRTCERLVCQTDVLATLAEVVGAQLKDDAGEDSEGFANVLSDAESSVARRSPVIHHGAKGRFAIREGHWKLVMPHLRSKAELYDLASDPSEKDNVVAEHPKIAKRLTATITRVVLRGRSTEGESQANDTPYWGDLSWMTKQQYDER